MKRRSHYILLLMAILIVHTGCASTRFTSTLDLCNNHDFSNYHVRFQIIRTIPPVSNNYMRSTTGPYRNDNKITAWCADSFRLQLMSVAQELYPTIFSTSSDALPVEIQIVNKNNNNHTSALLLELFSLNLFGFLLPLPVSGESSFTVNVRFLDTAYGLISENSLTFRRADFSWFSISPLGLLPVSGKSQRQKVSFSFNDLDADERTGTRFTLECIVEAIVHALEKSDHENLQNAYNSYFTLPENNYE